MEIEVLMDPNHSGIQADVQRRPVTQVCTPNGGSKGHMESRLEAGRLLDGPCNNETARNGPKFSSDDVSRSAGGLSRRVTGKTCLPLPMEIPLLLEGLWSLRF